MALVSNDIDYLDLGLTNYSQNELYIDVSPSVSSSILSYKYDPLTEDNITQSLREKFPQIKGIGRLSFDIAEVIYPLWLMREHAKHLSKIELWDNEYSSLFDHRYFIVRSSIEEIPVDIDLLLMFAAYKRSGLRGLPIYDDLHFESFYDEIFENIGIATPNSKTNIFEISIVKCLGQRGFNQKIVLADGEIIKFDQETYPFLTKSHISALEYMDDFSSPDEIILVLSIIKIYGEMFKIKIIYDATFYAWFSVYNCK
jgi:hypothetical protein